ncbi:MAG: PaaI family thioesterase [Firmicutes bacterium]|nr:PaaI family thioesterase [Bacillota bacterium]
MRLKVIKKQNNTRDCIVCGTENPIGLYARFYECLDQEGEPVLLTIFQTQHYHQSYPGRTHGGITSTLLDEAVGRAVAIPLPHAWGVTIELSIRFKLPVPLGEELYALTRVTKLTSRVFEGEGEVRDKDGKILATATGRYLQLKPEQITPEGVTPENWFYVPEDLPEFIEI